MQYAWFVWSLMLLAVWMVVFFSLKNKESKKEILVVSFWTMLLGLTEPIFVPKYWNPPSLFNLAQKISFDIESLLFAFGVGGISVAVYEWFFEIKHVKIPMSQKHSSRHRYHLLALISAPIIFGILFIFTSLNPIYSTIIALLGGGIFAWYCRPDLKNKMFFSGIMFTLFYFLFFLSLVLVFPNYVRMVWNLKAISGILILDVPLEELLFAFSLGFFWSSIYEHFKWRKTIPRNMA